MKKLTVRVTDEVYDVLVELARANHTTINDLLIESTVTHAFKDKLTLGKIVNKICNPPKEIDIYDKFLIKDLFTPAEWASYGSSVSIGGSVFNKACNQQGSPLNKVVDYVGKSGEGSLYKVIGDISLLS